MTLATILYLLNWLNNLKNKNSRTKYDEFYKKIKKKEAKIDFEI